MASDDEDNGHDGAGWAGRRMPPEARERAIVDGAITFFARHGFAATTRDLARDLGITQPLLYRYFPSKETLIERVYEEVFMQRWRPEWAETIRDRGRALRDRLIGFYADYAGTVYDFAWVRIFVYSGLRGMDLNRRYLEIVRDKVLRPVCEELRHAHGLPDAAAVPVSEAEIELAWSLHGAFFYRALRRYVYALPGDLGDREAIANDVTIFLQGAGPVQRDLVAGQQLDRRRAGRP